MRVSRLISRYWWQGVLAVIALTLSFAFYSESESASMRAVGAMKLKPRIELAEKMRQAISALQTERGYAMLYLGSHGRLYENELNRQIPVTDLALQDFDKLATYLIADQALSSTVFYEKLREVRGRIGFRDSDGIILGVYYSSLIGELLEAIEHLTEGGIELGLEVIHSYYLLLHGAERARKQHVLITMTLMDRKFDRSTFAWLSESISYQDSLLSILLAMAPQELRNIIESKLGIDLQALGDTLREELTAENADKIDPVRVYQVFEGKSQLTGEVFSHYGSYLAAQIDGVVDREQSRSRYWFVLPFVPLGLVVLAGLLENIRVSSRRYKELISSIDGVVWEYDVANSRITYISSKAKQLLGVSNEILLAKGGWQDLVHRDDRVGFLEKNRAGRDSGAPYTLEYRLVRGDGRQIWVHDQVNVVVEHCDARWLRGIMVDISARKEAETQARLAAEVLGNMVEGVFVTDPAATIVYANQAFSRISGYANYELLGESPSILKSGHHPKEFYIQMWSALNSVGRWQGEIWNRRKSGEIYPEKVAISAVRDQHGDLTHFIAVTSDMSEKRRTDEQIERLVRQDALTGLPNWPTLSLDLVTVLSHVIDAGNELFLLLVDIDRFRHVIYSVGYDCGDHILREVADRISSVCQGAKISRRGADVFCIAQIASSGEGAGLSEVLAERIRTELARPFPLDGGECILSTSIGGAVAPLHCSTISGLLRNAELALLAVKERGRDSYALFDPNCMDVQDFVVLEQDLRGALDRNELRIFLQPKVNALDGVIIGAEALLRWDHPTMGMVSPSRFIPVAEETGVIVPIGEWVIRSACELLRKWSDAGLAEVSLAVNVSARQFRHQNLLTSIVDAIADSAVSPHRLELELTESLLIDDPGLVARTLADIKEIGVQLAIDDFGTGYSSLNYLKRYPIDYLKIDQSFVRDIHADADDAAIVQAVIALAKSLRLKVVAEGVEHLNQLDYLRNLDCDQIQGYLFSKPVSVEQFECLLRNPVLHPLE